MKDLIDRQDAIHAFDDAGFCTHGYIVDVLKELPSAQTRMTCDGCKYTNHPTGWSKVCVLCIRNFRNFTDRYER